MCTFPVVVDHNRYHSFDICMTIYLNLKNAESEKANAKNECFWLSILINQSSTFSTTAIIRFSYVAC